jgi:LPXTG-motif cell wall-anchored protein
MWISGADVTVSAGGYGPGTTVRFAMYSTPTSLGTAVADAPGVATLAVSTPDGIEDGTHTVVSFGVDASGEARVLAQEVQVDTAAADTADSGSLPRTGVASLALVAAGVALIAGGLVTRAAARRRLARE